MGDINFKLSTVAIAWLSSHNFNPFFYHRIDEKPGLHLRNFGPDIIVPSRTKYIAEQSSSVKIDTGITLNLPPGLLGIIVPTESFAESSLINKSSFISGPEAHCCPRVVNYGELDIRIPHGAELPMRLIFSTQSHEFSISNDEEYIRQAKRTINSTIQKREM